MFNSRKILFAHIFLSILFFTSCYDEEKNTVKISGKLYNHKYPNSFNGREIGFYNTTPGISKSYLGTTKVNNKGEFSFEYEISPVLFGPYLRIGFDTFFVASSKFEFLPIGENWTETFNISDSASVFIKLTDNLDLSDTIYLNTGFDVLVFSGPTINQSLGVIKVLNSSKDFFYSTNKISNDIRLIYNSTGDPIVDTITLEINP